MTPLSPPRTPEIDLNQYDQWMRRKDWSVQTFASEDTGCAKRILEVVSDRHGLPEKIRMII
jgi:hypothetical protein